MAAFAIRHKPTGLYLREEGGRRAWTPAAAEASTFARPEAEALARHLAETMPGEEAPAVVDAPPEAQGGGRA